MNLPRHIQIHSAKPENFLLPEVKWYAVDTRSNVIVTTFRTWEQVEEYKRTGR